jgi:hypothetical protein
MKSQKRATQKQQKQQKPSRIGGQPRLLSRITPLKSALQSASKFPVAKLPLSRFPKQMQFPKQHQPRHFEAPSQRARTFSMAVKLREPPKPLIEIVQIPQIPPISSIPSIPSIPQNITFEMLANLYSDELLLNEIEILKKDAKQIATNIIAQNNFDETILRMISECKEKVRNMLWNKFYTTLTGNANTMRRSSGGNRDDRRNSGGNGRNSGSNRDANQSDYDAWYGDETTKPVIAKWIFRFSIFSFVYRVLKYCIKILTPSAPVPMVRRDDRQYYIDKMKSIRLKTLDDLYDSGIPATQIESILARFAALSEDKVELAMRERDRLERLPVSQLYYVFPPDIRNSGRNNKLYQPFGSLRHLKLHGMSLPYQFDRTELLRNMLYLLETFDIKRFVDLHDCEGITNTSECNPYDLSGERDMFNLAVKVMKRGGREYINIKGYVDMSSGSYSAWLNISRIPDTSVYETLVHCYMGNGRTGSVLLFLLLRDSKNIPKYINLSNRLDKPHLGYADIFELRNALFELFDKNYLVDSTVDELFNVKYMKRIRLLRQRLNRIFFFLAKKQKVSHVCVYLDIPPKPVIIKKIKMELKMKYPEWSKADIKDESYAVYMDSESNKAIMSDEFSKTKIYEMSEIESMNDSDIERILDGKAA